MPEGNWICSASVKLDAGSGVASRYQAWKNQVSPGATATGGWRGIAVRSRVSWIAPAAPEFWIALV